MSQVNPRRYQLGAGERRYTDNVYRSKGSRSELRCGHLAHGEPVVAQPVSSDRPDLYVCPSGCGLQYAKRRAHY